MPEVARTSQRAPWGEVGRWVEDRLGLHFPQRLWPDLQRGLEAAARRLGLPDAQACARRALSGAMDAQEEHLLAECLAIGETYFFRDPELFRQLAQRVLAPLTEARRHGSRHLRLWSAGCSSGEEPYSLALLLASLLPDWRDWNLFILGTDLNAAALRKARTAAYGRWSLRGGIPPECSAWLQPGADGKHHVDPELRRRVHFEQLNLAGHQYPAAATQTQGMDLVLCRNVLIYFEPARARAVLHRLGGALADEGWLVPGSVEIPSAPIPGLHVVRAGGLFALRRAPAVPQAPAAAAPATAAARAVAPQPQPRPAPAALPPIAARAAPAIPAPATGPAAAEAAAPAAPLLAQARERADAGDLASAEHLCREAVAQDKLDPACTYLLATILAERGAVDAAMAALRRTLYLDPGHLLARFNLGSLALRQGQREAGQRHLAQALARLAQLPADDVVPGSGGLTARELERAIRRTGASAP